MIASLFLGLLTKLGMRGILIGLGALGLFGAGWFVIELRHRANAAETALEAEIEATRQAVDAARRNADELERLRADAARIAQSEAALRDQLSASSATLARLKEQAHVSPDADHPVDLTIGRFLDGLRRSDPAAADAP
jgi:hypothetical protein